MKNAEYQGNLSCPQRASAEHEGYAGAQSVGGQGVKEQDGADLLERILSRENLNRAYKRVKTNKGAPGIDGMTVGQALPWLREHREELLEMIRQGKYKPQPVRRKEIPKPDGGVRKLGIPTVVDRIIQQAIAQQLTPIYEPLFSDNSFGYRPGRSAQMAILKVKEYAERGYTQAVLVDLSKYFDKLKKYSGDEVSRAGYDYAMECWSECLDYFNRCPEETGCSEPVFIPNMLSSNMPQVFGLLLKYGLDPNAVCEGETVLSSVSGVYNEYIAADTMALLMEHGGNPSLAVSGESLSDRIDFDLVFGAFEQENRRIYDSVVHCWFVLLGYRADTSLDLFARRRLECRLPAFRLEDLKDHRNYYYGLSNVHSRGEDWSLHIFDKRTRWEVVRL